MLILHMLPNDVMTATADVSYIVCFFMFHQPALVDIYEYHRAGDGFFTMKWTWPLKFIILYWVPEVASREGDKVVIM